MQAALAKAEASIAARVAEAAPPAPWPAVPKEGEKTKEKAEYIQDVLEDPPTNAAKVLIPAESMEDQTATMREGSTIDSTMSSGSLCGALGDVMDMSAADGDGQVDTDNSQKKTS